MTLTKENTKTSQVETLAKLYLEGKPAEISDESCFIDLDQETAHLLNYAKMKLLTEIPRQLKMVSYLRLCSIAIRKLHRKLGLADKNSVGESFDSYSNLLRALCNHNPEWWKLCWIGSSGILKSDDPIIDKLLQPLEYLMEIYTCTQ